MASATWERLIQRLITAGNLRSPPIIRALRRIPRDTFLPDTVKDHATMDSPLPIGFGQTISAPLS